MKLIKTLWLIDDDEIFVYLTRKIIDKTQLTEQIKVFENGQIAIDYLSRLGANSKYLPEIIFLDLMMPVLDGWGFLDEYKAMLETFQSKIKLYILSSSVSPQDIKRAKKFKGIVDFITKPITKEKITEIERNYEQ